MMTKESLILFAELLNQVAIRPTDEDAESKLQKCLKALAEIQEELNGSLSDNKEV